MATQLQSPARGRAQDSSLAQSLSPEPSPSCSPWSSDDELRSALDRSLSRMALSRGQRAPAAFMSVERDAATAQGPPARPPGVFQKPATANTVAPPGLAGPARPPGVFQKPATADVSPPPGLAPPSPRAALPPSGFAVPPGLPAPEAAAWNATGAIFSGETPAPPVPSFPTLLQRRKETAGFKQSARGAYNMHVGMSAPMALPGQLSLGSVRHSRGLCTPCASFWRPGGCPKGSQCTHCHLCAPGECERRHMSEAASRKRAERSSPSGVVEEDAKEEACSNDDSVSSTASRVSFNDDVEIIEFEYEEE